MRELYVKELALPFGILLPFIFYAWHDLFSSKGKFSADERINEIIRSLINIFFTQMYVVDALYSNSFSLLFTPEAMAPIDFAAYSRVFVFIVVPWSVSTYNLMDLDKMWRKPAWTIVDKGFAVHHLAAVIGVWLPTASGRFYPMIIAGCMMEWTSIAYNLREFIKIRYNRVPGWFDLIYKVFYSAVRILAITILFAHIDYNAPISALAVYLTCSSALTLFSVGVMYQMWCTCNKSRKTTDSQ